MEEISARVFMSGITRHRLGVVRGLLELEANGLVALSFAREHEWSPMNLAHMVMLELQQAQDRSKRIAYDLNDGPEIESIELLQHCDHYFKRSYCQEYVDRLPAVLKRKVQPYGLSMPADIEKWIGSAGLYWAQMLDAIGSPELSRRAYYFVKNLGFKVLRRRHSGYAIDPAFLPEPSWGDLAKNPLVFYQTRVWDPNTTYSHHHRSIEELNEFRITLARELNRALGSRFLGGVIPNDQAIRQCPDAITDLPTHFAGYLSSVDKALVGVTESGIHGSNGARLPELLGAGRCVVSERLVYEVPVPPREGKEIMTFIDVDECVEQCVWLLDNPEAAVEVARAGLGHYRREVAPAALASRALQACGLLDSDQRTQS